MNQIFNQLLAYFMSFGDYAVSDGRSLLVGGVVVVGVVIALMGVIKNLKPIKVIKNSTVRKVLLAWLSVALTFGCTVASVFLNQFRQEHFWSLCIINSIGTILLYWLYENTAVRNFVDLIGKNVLAKVLARKPKTIEELKELNEDIVDDVESLITPVESESLPMYKDDDLKNL